MVPKRLGTAVLEYPFLGISNPEPSRMDDLAVFLLGDKKMDEASGREKGKESQDLFRFCSALGTLCTSVISFHPRSALRDEHQR